MADNYEYSTPVLRHNEGGVQSSVIIRPAHGCDLPYLYALCLKTADAGADASRLFCDPLLIGQYYAAPYFFYDSALCFVLTADQEPAGYIVATADTPAFNEWMNRVWLPPLRLRYPLPYPPERTNSPTELGLVSLLHQPLEESEHSFVSAYPAHLHIDILPAQQGRGQGRALMERLTEALQERNVAGVHLGVSKRNTGAAAFYARMGFQLVQEENWGFILGKKL
ncbi:MAG: GNAT family N-acetyltransferase [Spirochaetaceae bacterium]|jgi:ribosomal protein S18 acetylase RimI-like enzyme|nr:GNAT family N-acetyltransferase [Spirochaetaceae bacterium]